MNWTVELNLSETQMIADAKLGFEAMPALIGSLLIMFLFLFVFGITGNLSVLFLVGRTIVSMNRIQQQQSNTPLHIYIYVMALAVVDFLVLSMIPLLLPYLYTGQWLLGDFLCRTFWTVENTNKILSIIFLTILSVERYVSVCHPTKSSFMEKYSNALISIGVSAVLTGLLLAPHLIYVRLEIHRLGSLELKSCGSNSMPNELFFLFGIYIFVVAYCLPAIVNIYCYTKIFLLVRQRFHIRKRLSTPSVNSALPTRNNSMPRASLASNTSKKSPLQAASLNIIRVTAFHFVCWTPFWFSVILPLLLSESFVGRHYHLFFVSRFYFTTLPYVNSAFNWVFYALMNKDLREQVLSYNRKQTATDLRSSIVLQKRNSVLTVNHSNNSLETNLLNGDQEPITML